MAFAAHGAEVTFTDKADVMAHCQANVIENFGQEHGDLHFAAFAWGTDPVAAGLEPPYSIVVATDVVYLHPQIVPLVDSLLALSDARTKVVVAIERRDESVWSAFQNALCERFRVKRVPVQKLQSRCLGEEEQAAADYLGIFVCQRRKGGKAQRPSREEQVDCEQQVEAARLAQVEPPGSGVGGNVAAV